MAALEGRSFVTPDDVKTAAVPVLAHRLMLRPEHWGSRVSTHSIVRSLLGSNPDTGCRDVMTFRASPLAYALAVVVAWIICLAIAIDPGRTVLYRRPAACSNPVVTRARGARRERLQPCG